MTLSWSDPDPSDAPWDVSAAEGRRGPAVRRAGRSTMRGRLNMWGQRALAGAMERTYGARKRALFADLPDTVVEIGPGPGTNLRYYRAGTRVVAIERSTWKTRSISTGVTPRE